MSDISLERLVGSEAARRMRSAGLNKLAAGRLRAEGVSVSDEFGLKEAVYALGHKLYEKNAEYKSVIESIAALAALKKD